ncbi:MFS transporter [Actinophytocola oryzae]|uniref:Putative MFS family arabinose efflux permease n=1 Tax=Actinophytocola oryzae TaxID=502181 RepID=A0A4R7VXP0_9PSEU|nr:MFS transporter [Actinophytocola oryzae]TDV54916.1 putative MFS family arabinose efflux permease [Actinophytocola oryzae]
MGQRRALLLLLAVISVNASYTVLIPFVPDLETRVGAGPVTIALMFALFAAAKALFQPVGGAWVDRWRPRAVACVALNVAAVGIVLTAFAGDPVTLLVGRFVWGIGEGLVTPALYAGMSALCRRYEISSSRMMGNFGSAAVAGFLLGPLVAGVAAPLGLEALFLVGAVLTSLTAFGLLRAIPDMPVEEADTTGQTGSAAREWWVWVLVLGLLDLFTHLVYTSLEPVLPLYLSDAAGGSAHGAISIVFVVGLATSAVSMWALGRFAERFGLVPLVAAGLFLLGGGLAGMAASSAVLPVAGAFLVVMVGYAVLFLTARRGIVELKSAAASQGAAFGLFGLVSDVGNVLGPVVGVVLYEVTGRVSFLLLGALAGALVAVLAALSGRWRRHFPSATVTVLSAQVGGEVVERAA